MAKQTINLGTPNGKDGDIIRDAFNKVNQNFTELYDSLGLNDLELNLGAFEFTGSTITTTDSSAVVIDQATTVTSDLTVGGDIVPSVAQGGDLGSLAKPWRSLYVSNNTIFIGGTELAVNDSGQLTVNGSTVSGGGGSGTVDLTNVASNIVPATDDTYSLGSPEKRWANIHLGPGTIFIEDTADPDTTAELTVTNGVLQINGADQLQVADVTADTITFDRTVTGVTAAKGQLVWNAADGTLDLGIGYDDVVLQIGQETHYVVRNATGSTILNGTAVYCSGVTAGSGRIEASPFLANNAVDSTFFLGLVTHDITNGVNGVVTHFGYVRNLDTRGTANTSISVGDENWSVGDKLYAHPTAAGKLTNVEPTLPDQKICVASIINRHQSVGVLFVRPSQHIPTDILDLTDTGNLLGAGSADSLTSTNDINITVNNDDSSTYTWNFGNTGNLTFPDATVQTTAYLGPPTGFFNGDTGAFVLPGGNIVFQVDGVAPVAAVTGEGLDVNKITTGASAGGDDLTIVTNDGGDIDIDAATTGIVSLASQSGGLSIGRVGGSTDVYGEVEFNNGTTLFQGGNSVSFNGAVNFTNATVTGLDNLSSEGDISIRVNLTDSTTHTWRFGEDGDLTLPGGAKIEFIPDTEPFDDSTQIVGSPDGRLSLAGVDNTGLARSLVQLWGDEGRVSIATLGDNSSQSWVFDGDGNLNLPTNVPGVIQSENEINIRINLTDSTTRTWRFGEDGNTEFPGEITATGINSTGEFTINVEEFGQEGTYTFSSGRLELPGGWSTPDLVLGRSNDEIILWTPGEGRSLSLQSNNGSRTWNFGADGGLRFPDSTIQTTAYVKTSGEWEVTSGTNTYSFTVPADGTYVMWVKGNIPNGIITWNATASVSNTNVPAIGTQYAWNYTGGGSPILLTSIPDQIKGSAGTISTDATYAGTTSNRFDFGISNTSGSTQTIYYGYTKIS